MKITLNTNFYIDGVSNQGYINLRKGSTVRDLLQDLAKRCHDETRFINPDSDQIDPDEYSIHVTQTALEYLPKGLETELKDGDLVTIIYWMDVLGGG